MGFAELRYANMKGCRRAMKGGCFCGEIRYEILGETYHQTVCHCSICRRTTGAPLVAWFSVSAGDFRFTSGTPARFRSSSKGARTFCPSCGTQLTLRLDDNGHEVDVTTASLDDPGLVPPADHTYYQDRIRWVSLSDSLPTYDHGREKR